MMNNNVGTLAKQNNSTTIEADGESSYKVYYDLHHNSCVGYILQILLLFETNDCVISTIELAEK